jgi:hypothetical protein
MGRAVFGTVFIGSNGILSRTFGKIGRREVAVPRLHGVIERTFSGAIVLRFGHPF